MISTILNFIPGEIWVGIGALFAGFVAYLKGRSDGGYKHRAKAAQDALDRTEKGRDAVRDIGDDPAQQLRDNDGNW